jgi:CDP-diacylglycerol--glycerol-3-phosphate 3-phosphatidyltransferase
VNLPNKLTVLRICLIPFFVILARLDGFGMQLAAVLIYIIACATDALDGHIARSRGLVTNFGKFMDPIADKLLVMSAMIVLTWQHRMPDWVCILMLAREFLVSGFRLVAVENGVIIAAGPLGKLKTVFQMVSTVALMLLVSTTGAHPLGQAGFVAANVLMYVALALTVVSGADYIIRNRDCIRDM